MSWRPPGETLDEVAAAVFGGEAGRARLQPLLRRYDDEVGRILDDDEKRETLLAIRMDWALCDAPIPEGRGEGDTWVRRAVAGAVEGVRPEPAWTRAVGTYAGIFEVWPGTRPFLRDRIGGLCVTLADRIHVEPVPDPGSPAALWEARLFIDETGVHLCRTPLPYPLALRGWLAERQIERFAPRARPVPLQRLRRRWLQYSRSHHADPLAIFGL